MRSKSNRWLSGVGVVVIAGGLVLANFGGGITSAQAHDRTYKNPFKQIMTKLDEILMKLNGGSAPAGGAATQPLPRFTVLADNNAAVRDNSTGLVWEQTPSTPATDWSNARLQCINKNVGNTRGWRLPSVVELTSLIDPSVPAPYVPGAVFTGVQTATYWSATASAVGTTSAFGVNFQDGLVGTSSKGSSSTANVWCVRGQMQESVY